jgi:hypothetical protein
MLTVNMSLMPSIFLFHIISKQPSNSHILGQLPIACVKNYPKVMNILNNELTCATNIENPTNYSVSMGVT